jgi:hypothetical protein
MLAGGTYSLIATIDSNMLTYTDKSVVEGRLGTV